jgi:hypothetical protein
MLRRLTKALFRSGSAATEHDSPGQDCRVWYKFLDHSASSTSAADAAFTGAEVGDPANLVCRTRQTRPAQSPNQRAMPDEVPSRTSISVGEFDNA